MGNVFSYLKNAKEANSETDVKKCLDYISQVTGAKIEVKEDRSITIEISDPKTPWAEFSKNITNLSKIFDDKLAISFKPGKKEKVPEILAFIETNGKLIASLNLTDLENFIDDDFAETSIQSCPNLYQLFILSTKIEGKGLAALSALKSLTALDLSKCLGLTALPDTEVMAENLATFVNADLRDRSVNITPWLEDESFWDEDTYELNKAGAHELLKIAKREEAKTLFSQMIGEAMQKLVASQFSGTNPLMQELAGTNRIEQGAHQSIYLKNLIGNLVGVSQAVTFDRHTGMLYDNLINKTREEVLSTFFKHVTPEVMVNEVLRTLKEPSTETTEALKAFLPEDKYWDENGALSKRGALQLLATLNYVTSL